MSDTRPSSESAAKEANRTQHDIKLPRHPEQVDQDSEYCSVLLDGVWQDIRFHDYGRIFAIPGLYEQLFHDILDCRSPDVVAKLLKEELQRDNVTAASLRVLDLGAGNGLVGEQLRTVGVGHLAGIDILPQARTAALRDRPEVYDAYHVLDMTNLSETDSLLLERHSFNALTCVAALGYGDIPPSAFRAAYNLVSDGAGWRSPSKTGSSPTPTPRGSPRSSLDAGRRVCSTCAPASATGTGWTSAAAHCTTSRSSAPSRVTSPPTCCPDQY